MKHHKIEQGPNIWLPDVNGDVNVANCNLTSFRGAPRVVTGNFICMDNNITSLDGVPEEVGGDFMIDNNNIRNLHNIHKHIKRIDGFFFASGTGIESHVLGLCLIKGLKGVSLFQKNRVVPDLAHPIDIIMNKYLGGNPENMLMCQQELIEAGFQLLAKL